MRLREQAAGGHAGVARGFSAPVVQGVGSGDDIGQKAL
jgi:hypothetical protein